MAPFHKTPSEDGKSTSNLLGAYPTNIAPIDIASTLAHIQLSSKNPQKPAQKPKSKPVADSWDEEDVSGSNTETEDDPTNTTNPSGSSPRAILNPLRTVPSISSPPNAPPPTPASPTPFSFSDNVAYSGGGVASLSRGDSGAGRNLDRRPEKTTAVAGRLIAGALGVRPPKRTEEEKEFDRVVKEKERKRRADEKEREKRAVEETEARKKAVWDD